MGRGTRKVSDSGYYHVIVRGNNKARLFHKDKDFEAFLDILSESLSPSFLKLHNYCLMTNHIHLLISVGDIAILSRFMHRTQRSYHHYYRKHYTWFGHLFQGRYRSLPIETDSYLLDCGRYIERNPVRANLVKDPKDWRYSSYRYYAEGIADSLVTPSVAYEAIADDVDVRQALYKLHVETTRPYEDIIDKELIGTKSTCP